MDTNPLNIDKYLYIDRTPTWLIRFIYSVGILTWIGVLFGYYNFYAVNPVFFWLIAPVIFYLFVYHVLSYSLMLFYKQYDVRQHKLFRLMFNLRKLSNDGREYPLVDIFLPICGEETDVIKNTFDAVSKLDYPNYKVYVLDDRGDSDHRTLAHHYHFIYMSRDNKGEMKKAGNLKHGFERSDGDFIVVFDADFAPHPDFIRELLPYMADPKVAIVQSPQYFQTDREVHKTSALQYGASHVQEDFYRFIQVARSRLGAPICCGSNAIYRRSALNEIGGTVQIEHSEDAYTGFELTNRGYRVLFVPIILAIGLCPDNLHSYFHQQHRWCSGSLSLMLSKRFWQSNLSFSQKLCFISGFMYYLSHPITLLISFQVFFVLLFYYDTLNFYNALPFIPCMVFSFFAIPLIRITKMRFGGFLARNAYIYAYSHATFVAFVKKSVGWQPTNTKRLDVSKEYREQLNFVALYFLVYVLLFSLSVGIGTINIKNLQSYSLLFWVFYNLITNSVVLVYLYILMDTYKKKNVKTKKDKFIFIKWRIKTGGLYVFTLFLFSSGGVVFGQVYQDNKLNNVRSEFNPVDIRLEPSAISNEIPLNDDNRAALISENTNSEPEENKLKKAVFTEDYELTDVSVDVKMLQRYLNDIGYTLAPEGPGAPGLETEYFGELTKSALMKFQADNDLPITGFFGPQTRKAVNEKQI